MEDKYQGMCICRICQCLIKGVAVESKARGRKMIYIHPSCIKEENERNRRAHEAANRK